MLKDVFFMDPDPDFFGSDPDFWPIRIRTHKSLIRIREKNRIQNTGKNQETEHWVLE